MSLIIPSSKPESTQGENSYEEYINPIFRVTDLTDLAKFDISSIHFEL